MTGGLLSGLCGGLCGDSSTAFFQHASDVSIRKIKINILLATCILLRIELNTIPLGYVKDMSIKNITLLEAVSYNLVTVFSHWNSIYVRGVDLCE